MKKILKIFILVLLPFIISFSQEEKKVLIEVFTNSHCPLCPPAHSIIDNYLVSPNRGKINFIFYHMVYPYSDDPLYHHNHTDSDGRHDYYNPVAATPRGFFDGQIQGNTSAWISILDSLVLIQSPLKIDLTGIKSEESITIKAEITRTGNVTDNDLVIHFVVVEDLDYTGRNGIPHHENVMRKMVDGAMGFPFSINLNETKEIEREILFNPAWLKDSLKVLVFIQSSVNKTVYQSAIINFSDLISTGMNTDLNLPDGFKLNQNYPNPFNPETTIGFHISQRGFVNLKVFDSLGKQIAILVNEEKEPGFFEINFRGNDFSSGLYFYKLQSGNYIETKKMILLK
ncbi:MAG TPA: T9SS type A sorting domain-containing protein [Ignavibacteriaceae bacterium]|nr:T9SS type A sorting domain-containing protein [Ignavibacteriaceae bacterium]